MFSNQLQNSIIPIRIAKKLMNKNTPPFFYVLICSWNCFEYLDRCIDSVLGQKYKNYQIIFVDDNSLYTSEQIKHIRKKLSGHLVFFNKKRKFALENIYTRLHDTSLNRNAVIFNLDGDDWLKNDDVLMYVANVYLKENCWFTYGNCEIWNGNDLTTVPATSKSVGLNLAYPKKVITTKKYRKEVFFPLHPRTWLLSVFLKIDKRNFLDQSGNWLKFAYDMAIFFPLLESNPEKLTVIRKILSVYNVRNTFADNKVNAFDLVKTELFLRQKSSIISRDEK